MSFDIREVARWLGKPVELYRFTRQDLNWRYASGDQSIVVADETFEPLAISRESLKESYERQKRNLKITIPIGAEVAQNWQPFPPGDTITVTVMAMHRGDGELVVQWTGRVIQPRYTDTSLELTCAPGIGSNRPRGVQLRFQRSCTVALYSQGVGMCNLAPADFAAAGVLDDVDGNIVSASAWASLPDGRLAGGFIEWTSTNGLLQRRSITAHGGAQLHLHYGASDLEPGLAVTAYHGCAHNFGDCDSKGNGVNYGGCANLPQKNPFSGDPIWW